MINLILILNKGDTSRIERKWRNKFVVSKKSLNNKKRSWNKIEASVEIANVGGLNALGEGCTRTDDENRWWNWWWAVARYANIMKWLKVKDELCNRVIQLFGNRLQWSSLRVVKKNRSPSYPTRKTTRRKQPIFYRKYFWTRTSYKQTKKDL